MKTKNCTIWWNIPGRVIEDEESDYDSEMDDFIDDGDAEGDYSSEIKKIFGYDKSRYVEHFFFFLCSWLQLN